MADTWRIKSLHPPGDQFTMNVTPSSTYRDNKYKTAYAYGIACCRVFNGKPEILLICKRNTYAYRMFILGAYKHRDTRAMIELFSKMTLEEKIDILSLNFSQMWYRQWLNRGGSNNYFICRSKFTNTFLTDGGTRLRTLISQSTNAQPIWEIPKGRKNNRNEKDVTCAIREFGEETGICKSKYKVFTNRQNTYSFIDDGVKYVNIYYTAIINDNNSVRGGVNNALKEQLYEVTDCRWMDIDAIRFVDRSGRLEKFVKLIFPFVKKQ